MEYTKEMLQAIRLQVIGMADLILCTGSSNSEKAIAELAKDRLRDNCRKQNVIKYRCLLNKIVINKPKN